MSFSQNHKLPALALTECSGRFPLCGVDTPVFHIAEIASGNATCLGESILGVGWSAILLWFDFNDRFVELAICLAGQNPEVGEVSVVLAIDRGLVGDGQFFAGPFDDGRAVVAIPHEAKLQRRAIDDVGRIPLVFLGIAWFEFTFVRHIYYVAVKGEFSMVSVGEAFGSIVNPNSNKIQGQRGTLDALEVPNRGIDGGALTYPRDIDLQSGHFILFHIVEPTPGAGKLQKALDTKASKVLGKALNFFGVSSPKQVAANIEDAKQLRIQRNLTPIDAGVVRGIVKRGRERIERTNASLLKANASNSALTSVSQTPLNTTTLSTVLIYMPEKITTGYGFEYQGESLRLAAAGSKIFDITKDALGGASTLTKEQQTEFTKSLGEEFGTRFGTKLIDDLGSLVGANIGARSFLEKNVRRIVNPHMQFLYRSTNQRTFEYTFHFTPHDHHESEVIDNIIRTFKFFSHPEVLGQRAGRLHGYPAEFDIQYVSRELYQGDSIGNPRTNAYYFQENDWLNRIGRCYLSNISVDYSPTGVFATHHHLSSPIPEVLQSTSDNPKVRTGNPPTNITMTLTFHELETLNRQHILEGF